MLSDKPSAESAAAYVLAVNGGSSSIKFALCHLDERAARRLRGKIDRIGLPETSLSFEDAAWNQRENRGIEVSGF